MYEVLLERRAERDLKQLPPSAFKPIIADIRSLAVNPRPPGSRKIVGSQNDWRIRVGVYRVVYEIDDVGRTVRVMRIRDRKDVCR